MIYRPKLSPPRQHIPAVYMRGGTSKALFFHEDDVPPPGNVRDELLKQLMGTPDPLQINGMGGAKAVTSKVAIVRRSARPDADIDYTFVQVGIECGSVVHNANCGNVSSAVGPFAIEEGLIDTFQRGVSVDPKICTQAVRIYNTNTDKVLTSHVPIDKNGAPLELGDFAIAAVPGTGAPILMDYVDTIGARLHKGVLPTGKNIDIVCVKGKNVQITICDAGNPMIFFHAEDLGITGHESADEINANMEFIAAADELRGRATQYLGLCDDWTKVDEQSPFMPAPIAIAKTRGEGDFVARCVLEHKCHESMSATAAICTAACSRVPGSIIHQVLSEEVLERNALNLSHPLGVMPIMVKTKDTETSPAVPSFETLSFIRTARRIMEGALLVPQE